jgi:four helix bundle protein
MLKPHSSPYGFRNLLAYKKAEELQDECSRLTSHFPFSKTLSSLSDQMNRSARSGKQNIVEGWKRNTTREYFDFLGFSIGAIAELEEDCDDVWKGRYPELMGIKGIMGERGLMGAPPTPPTHSTPFSPSSHFTPFDIERLPFYPLDKSLPPVVQLKLRCKELNFLLTKLQKSLENKMLDEKTMTANDRARLALQKAKEGEAVFNKYLKKKGLKI